MDNTTPFKWRHARSQQHSEVAPIWWSKVRIAALLLIDNFVSTGMCLTFPHSFISDRVNMPAILCHFLYIPKKLIPRFSLKHS
jgi:hypothetical protein